MRGRDNGPVRQLTTTEATRARMSKQRARDTTAEVELRRHLHRLGLRYRVHRRPLPTVRREADLVFGPAKGRRVRRRMLLARLS